MINLKLRDKCILCENPNLSDILILSDMPIFMGAIETSEIMKSNMTFSTCNSCNNIQIKEIIDPELLYMNNHNTGIIGPTWEEHYIELSKFMQGDINDKVVYEIGDPSYKISRHLSDSSKSWYIIELNPDLTIQPPPNVKIIQGYFDDSINLPEPIDIFVHSHFFEHLDNPIEHLRLIHKSMMYGGKLIFSIPNLEIILKSGQSPNAVLHFEHTYFYTEHSITKLLNKIGFKIDKVHKYKNHSLFFSCEKVYADNSINITIDKDLTDLFYSNYKKFECKINDINQYVLNEKNIFLFGCHISSQFLINIGLNISKINGIIDNSNSKIGKYLYGTKLMTMSPLIIQQYEAPIVIVSHMSIYVEEISKQLLKINPNTILL